MHKIGGHYYLAHVNKIFVHYFEFLGPKSKPNFKIWLKLLKRVIGMIDWVLNTHFKV
jgi:hypothetical protein